MSRIEIASAGRYEIKGRGTVLSFLSPIAAPREFKQYLEAIGGNPVKIDGIEYEATGLECFCLGAPIRAGESISLAVKPIEARAGDESP